MIWYRTSNSKPKDGDYIIGLFKLDKTLGIGLFEARITHNIKKTRYTYRFVDINTDVFEKEIQDIVMWTPLESIFSDEIFDQTFLATLPIVDGDEE